MLGLARTYAQCQRHPQLPRAAPRLLRDGQFIARRRPVSTANEVNLCFFSQSPLMPKLQRRVHPGGNESAHNREPLSDSKFIKLVGANILNPAWAGVRFSVVNTVYKTICDKSLAWSTSPNCCIKRIFQLFYMVELARSYSRPFRAESGIRRTFRRFPIARQGGGGQRGHEWASAAWVFSASWRMLLPEFA
jgi:hypothetical protein